MEKLLAGQGEGARQLASTLSVYAATISDAQIRATVQRLIAARGRQDLLFAPADHTMMEGLATEFGIPRSLLPPHKAPDPVARGEAIDLVLKEGLAPSMRRAAGELETASRLIDARQASLRSIALQPPSECLACAMAENAETLMEVICAAAAVACVVFPPDCPAAEAGCAAAAATWLALWTTCQIGRMTGLC